MTNNDDVGQSVQEEGDPFSAAPSKETDEPRARRETMPAPEQLALGPGVAESGKTFRKVSNSFVRAAFTLVVGGTLALCTLAAVWAWIFRPGGDPKDFSVLLAPLAALASAAAGFYFGSSSQDD